MASPDDASLSILPATMSGRRLLLLAEESFGPTSSKTANAAIRYIPDEVVAVLDSTRAGQTAQQVLGYGGDIPVVATIEEGLALGPTAALVGVAPPGGRIPEAWRALISSCITAKLDVWSGMHVFLSEDPEFSALAREAGVQLFDLRRPPADLPVATGLLRDAKATLILTVGTDCNVGKMTAQLEILSRLRAAGKKTAFAATGQTGILIEGRGIAVDAVIADFIAGAAERLTMEAAEGAEIVLVEGQGSLVHPGYSGVTLGLTHGSMPHAFILCGQPSRTTIRHNPWLPTPPLSHMVQLYEQSMAYLRPERVPVIAVALNTHDLSEAEARAAIAEAERETGLPATDPVRFDPMPLVEAVLAFHERRLRGAAESMTGAAVGMH